MSIDASRVFEAITDYVEATVEHEVAQARDEDEYDHSKRVARDHARQALREVLREELDP